MSISPSDTARSLAKNAASQIAGRLLLSLGRLVVAILIVRHAGAARFGEYALVLSFIVVFEWLVDFGQTDIAVRNICQQPEREGATLGALASLKLLQGLLFAILLPSVVFAMDYPPQIVRAAGIGGIGLLSYAGVQIFRTVFKTRMRMERDIIAELGGLVVMLPLTWYACHHQAGVDVLIGCYAVSRVIFFLLALLLGRATLSLARGIGRTSEVLELLRQAAPLGIAGILIAIYDGLAPVVLSKMSDMSSVAEYAAAARYVFPVIIVVQALNSAIYPPLAASWRTSPEQFARLQQAALEASILIGAGLFCGIHASAGFLIHLIGPSVGGATIVLKLMAWVVLARTVTTAMAPLIVVTGVLGRAMWLAAASVVAEIAMLIVLVPHYGAFGAAIGYLTVELVLGAAPVSAIGQHFAGLRVRWLAPAKLMGCAALSVGICASLPSSGTLLSGVLGIALYLVFAFVSGAISPRELHKLFAEVMAGAPQRYDPVVIMEKTEP